MRILSRYLLAAFLLPLTYCLVTFVALYAVIELVDTLPDIMEARPPVGTVLLYFSGYIAPLFEWLLAAALLLASLYTMWQLCRHSEVTAMRTSGLGLSTIIAPMVGVAVFLSLVAALNMEFFVPYAAEASKRIKQNDFQPYGADVRDNIHYYNTSARRIWRINRMDLFKPEEIEGVQITFERSNGTREMDISCKRAVYKDGMWWLFYPQYAWFDEIGMRAEPVWPELTELPLRAMPTFGESPADFVNETRDWTFLPIRAKLRFLRVHPNLSADERQSKWYDIHYRMAAPWVGVVITLFAIPMGIATGRQSVFKGILAAIALFFAFFATVNAGMILAKKEMLPAIAGAWLPNIIFLGTGLWLLWRQR